MVRQGPVPNGDPGFRPLTARVPDAEMMLTRYLDRVLHHPAALTLHAAAREVTGLLVPSWCVVCDVEPSYLDHACAPCRERLARALLHPFPAEEHAASLPLIGQAPLPVLAAGRYTEEIARALLAFKDHGRLPAARLFRPGLTRAAGQLARTLKGDPGAAPWSQDIVLVPIPGSGSGFRRRGYDPVTELLRTPLPWPVEKRLLRHRVQVMGGTAHAGSSATTRRRRARQKFRALPGPPRRIVLIDDVLTTGATLAAAWRVLSEQGHQVMAAVVVAAVTRDPPDPETRAESDLNVT